VVRLDGKGIVAKKIKKICRKFGDFYGVFKVKTTLVISFIKHGL